MSELRAGFTFNKRRLDAWTVDVLDGYGVVCSVPAAGPDDEVAESQARRIAAALGGQCPEVDVAQHRNDDEVSVALQQVYARIAEKRGMVVRLSLAAEEGASPHEGRRLAAKAEGMSVAASYVDEAIRVLRSESADDTVKVPRAEWDALVDAVRLERAERAGQPHISAVYHAWGCADALVSAVEANQ